MAVHEYALRCSVTKELRQADLDPARFEEILKAAAGGADYRVIVRVVRILPEPEQVSPDAFAKVLAYPGVARRFDRAVKELKRSDVIPDEEMD